MVLVQQGHDMFIHELLNLKPGTFIKGFDLFHHSEDRNGRCATFKLDGWRHEGGMYNSTYVVRTPIYNNPTFEPCNAIKAKEIIDSNLLSWHCYGILNDSNVDMDIEAMGSMEWGQFKYNDPIGIHIGSFGVHFSLMGENEPLQLLVFTKMLFGNGEVGYLVCVTNDVNKQHLELL